MTQTQDSPTLIADPKRRGILIVEDDLGPRESLHYLLRSCSYVNVHCAQDGQDAITQLASLGPAVYLILLDLRMPVMNGITFLHHLAGDCPHPVGVIAATALPTEDGKQQFMEACSTNLIPLDYIGKPFDLTDLLELVARSLDRIHTQRVAAATD